MNGSQLRLWTIPGALFVAFLAATPVAAAQAREGIGRPLPGVVATDAAITQASAQAARTPGKDEAWISLGDAFMQKARETADTGYYGRAEQSYRKALAINPKCIAGLTGIAWVSGGKHEFETSIEYARKVLALDPKNAAAYGLIGDADVEMGDYDDAFEEYQKMLDIHPDLSSYGRSGHLLQLMGDTKKASWLMTKAIMAGSPYGENTAWCRSQLALIYFSEGAYVPAEQVLEEGLKKVPNDFHLLAAMGKVKAARKDWNAAITYYTQAIAIAPQQETVAALGDIYQVTGQTAEAARQYSLMESIAVLNKANGIRGDILTAKFYADHDQKLPDAVRLAEEEYKTRKNVYAADTLAWCYYKNGQLPEARKYMRLALQHKTPEALFYFHRGMIFAKLGDRVSAQQALYQAMSINPNFDPIQAEVAIQTMAQLGSEPPPTQAAFAGR